jgi:hypothetical protein
MLRRHDGTLAMSWVNVKYGFAWIIVAYLLSAAAFELVLAIHHRFSPHGEGFVLSFALLAILAAMVLVFRRVPFAGLFAPAAALFVTARFYTGDPYYRPLFREVGQTYFRSYADGGIFAPTWVFVLLGGALLAGITTQLWRRTAPVESAVVLFLLLVTALYMGAGH